MNTNLNTYKRGENSGWDDAFCVGLKEMDTRNMIIFSCFDDLMQLVNQNMSINSIRTAYHNMVTMMKYSFKEEENYMVNAEHNFDAVHKIQHDDIIGRLEGIDIDLDTVQAKIKMVSEIFYDWILIHVTNFDRNCCAHFFVHQLLNSQLVVGDFPLSLAYDPVVPDHQRQQRLCPGCPI